MNQQTELSYQGPFPTGGQQQPLTVSGNTLTSAPACELMFFCGAPFAHVVQYEDHMRTKRKDHESRTLLRNQPPKRWRGFQETVSASLIDAYVREAPAA
jgi:hypothetical protein